jgi:outer membrane protein assembly factor BamD (BamD/ComL family)
LTLGAVACRGQGVDLARDYYRHGLADKAKEILISSVHDKTTLPVSKAEALYLLGQISYEQEKFSVAFEDWQRLVKDYPQSTQAKEISSRLSQLSDAVSKRTEEELSSAVASSYLHNGDFWSKSNRIFTIDSSWLSYEEMAIFWYDKLIREFSSDAEIGYEREIFTLLGWDGPDGSGGIRKNYRKYMPQLIETFSKFEKQFPNSSFLQPFRFMIAQAYWRAGGISGPNADTEEAKVWFQKVIDSSQGVETFYTRCAKDRLQNLHR